MSRFEFIPGLQAIKAEHYECVATIGTFDGVHKGHQAILARLNSVARQQALPSTVIIFEPQPYEFFSGEKAPARITRLRDKVLALRSTGVDRVICLRFDAALRSLSADAFVREVLVKALGVKHLEVGDDFRFGCDRAGDFELLCRLGSALGFSVADTQTLTANGQRISSTRIRTLLEQGELSQAHALLGRTYTVTGKVGHGRKLGRQIGVPTANIQLGRCRAAVKGVFAVSVTGVQPDTTMQGVANVGVRPTVDGGPKPLLEVHLFDWQQDFYGTCLEVSFHKKIRDEQTFESVAALTAQIQKDIEQVKTYFKNTNDDRHTL